MLNRPGVRKESAITPNDILFNAQNHVSVGITLAKNFVGAVTENGRKIVKAGTPLNGDLKARGTAFVAAANTSNPAVGVLRFDVDVTDSAANGTLVIWGFVNMNRLDSTTAGLITAEREEELAGRVWFLKD